MSKGKTFLTLFSLGVAGGSIYIIPYIKYVFYDQQREVMGITNAQSGLLLTVFAITAIVLFIPGGMLADKLNSKKLIVGSLIGTSVLTVIYACTFNFKSSLIIWILLGVCTAATFWSAFIKTVNSIGNAKNSGKTFGIYYACNGISAATINSVALKVSTIPDTARTGLFAAMIVVAAGTLIGAVMVILFVDRDDSKQPVKTEAEGETLNEEKIKVSDLKFVLRSPAVWLMGILNFVSYSIYSSTSYFNPYLIDVVGVLPEESGIYSIIRTYLFMLLAPVGGLMCDKVFKASSKWFMCVFAVVGALMVGIFLMPSDVSVTFASVYTLIPAAFTMAQYGVFFSIIRELHVPPAILGTTIGLSSMISWLPDLFMHTMFGSWLDRYGNTGYTYIFTYLTGLAIIGIVASVFALRRDKKYRRINGTES